MNDPISPKHGIILIVRVQDAFASHYHFARWLLLKASDELRCQTGTYVDQVTWLLLKWICELLHKCNVHVILTTHTQKKRRINLKQDGKRMPVLTNDWSEYIGESRPLDMLYLLFLSC
jgi:hypothetical protein